MNLILRFELLKEKLSHFVLWRLIYAYAMLMGLFPAPFDWRNQRFVQTSSWPNILYLIYSALLHFAIFPLFFCTYPGRIYETNYLSAKPVLKASYIIKSAIKLTTVTSVIIEMWRKRRKFQAAFSMYGDFRTRYQRLDANVVESTQLQQSIQRQINWKLATSFGYVIFSSIIYFEMNWSKGVESKLLIYLAINFVVTTFVMTMMFQFFFIVCHFYKQFALINFALMQLQYSNELILKTNVKKSTLLKWRQRLQFLCNMHFDCQRLTLHFFHLVERISAAIILKSFSANVDMVYHFVLFVSGDIKADASGNLSGLSMVFIFYLDIILLMRLLDKLIKSCNETAFLLQQFDDADLVEEKVLTLSCEFQTFADYLRNHKLRFNICGLFTFDMESSLQFFLQTFVHVIILVQFQLQLNLGNERLIQHRFNTTSMPSQESNLEPKEVGVGKSEI